ncbi:hypothetical protein EST38_g11840 [Candolleomyces aberdarensis]|uniref:Uncharacterized protein n=1 Tax=Candolleomyces aberdarensis TaxID=2316362 RepID=A0A4Q2D665_9AGAR|nr:hypothetical protein EST38_g11840 [Candolleomyces aberdarensis]
MPPNGPIPLEELYIEGRHDRELRSLEFTRPDNESLATADRLEYALGLRRGGLSGDRCPFNRFSLVCKDMSSAFGRWALFPGTNDHELAEVVYPTLNNIKRRLHSRINLTDAFPTRPAYPFRLYYFERYIKVMAPGKYNDSGNGEPFQLSGETGTVVTAAVHPFMVLHPAASFSRCLKEICRFPASRDNWAWNVCYLQQWFRCLAKVFPEEWLATAPPGFERTTTIRTWPYDIELDSEEEKSDPQPGEVRRGSKPGELVGYLQFPGRVVKKRFEGAALNG